MSANHLYRRPLCESLAPATTVPFVSGYAFAASEVLMGTLAKVFFPFRTDFLGRIGWVR